MFQMGEGVRVLNGITGIHFRYLIICAFVTQGIHKSAITCPDWSGSYDSGDSVTQLIPVHIVRIPIYVLSDLCKLHPSRLRLVGLECLLCIRTLFFLFSVFDTSTIDKT